MNEDETPLEPVAEPIAVEPDGSKLHPWKIACETDKRYEPTILFVTCPNCSRRLASQTEGLQNCMCGKWFDLQPK